MPLSDFISSPQSTKIDWKELKILKVEDRHKFAAIYFWLKEYEKAPIIYNAWERIEKFEKYGKAKFDDFIASFQGLKGVLSNDFTLGLSEFCTGVARCEIKLNAIAAADGIHLFSVNFQAKKDFRKEITGARTNNIARYGVVIRKSEILLLFIPGQGEIKTNMASRQEFVDTIFRHDTHNFIRIFLVSLALKSESASTAQARPKSPTPPQATPQGAVGGHGGTDDMFTLGNWDQPEFDFFDRDPYDNVLRSPPPPPKRPKPSS